MNIKFRDEIIINLEKTIESTVNAVIHLESLCRNVPNELSIQEKRNYTNKLYDDIEAFDRFKQNVIIILNEAKKLTHIETISSNNPVEVFRPSKMKTVNNASDNDFAYTTIDRIVFCGKEYSVRNWADALITITEIVIKDKKLDPLLLVNCSNLKGKKRNYFSNESTTLKRAYQLSNGCYLELNFSARDIYRISHLIVSEFGYAENDLEICYSKKNGNGDVFSTNVKEKYDLVYVCEISKDAYNDPVKMLEELEKKNNR